MDAADQPVLIAYDGSAPSRGAIRQAVDLLRPRRAIVATVWEPGLAYVSMSSSIDMSPAPMVDPETAHEIDDSLHVHAERIAQDGADLARSLGFEAEPLAVADESHVSDALLRVARERSVAAIVVGSRGLTGLRARLEGSTSKSLIKHADCPVLVIHEQDA